ncbi:ribosomal protein L24e [Trichuris suis]|nr:ribosomal protein L24e [Trichuris suis]
MKTETCVFSGHKIYPGHGKRSVRADGKVNIFINKKCERSLKMRRNPRDTAWTILYRRKHKKLFASVLATQTVLVTQATRGKRTIDCTNEVIGSELYRNLLPSSIISSLRVQKGFENSTGNKGVQAEEVVKRKVKKVQKFQRAIGTHSVADILAKRNQKPEFRRAQREQAVKAAKEKTREQKAVKKAEKLKNTQKVSAAAASKQKAAKPVKTQAPRVTGRR